MDPENIISGDVAEECFSVLKRLCGRQPVLAFYDVNMSAEILCNVSKDGLGAVVIQSGRQVAYPCRSLTDTENCYGQIEKKMLSIIYATIQFHNYIFGKGIVCLQ